jgi:hypothetical protein
VVLVGKVVVSIRLDRFGKFSVFDSRFEIAPDGIDVHFFLTFTETLVSTP